MNGFRYACKYLDMMRMRLQYFVILVRGVLSHIATYLWALTNVCKL